MRDGLVAGAVVVALVVVLVIPLFWVKAAQCEARWAQSNRNSDWNFFSGCLVESQGIMVPETRIWYERNQ